MAKIHGAQLTKVSVLFICDQLTITYTSLIYEILFNPLSTLFHGVWSEIQPSDREGVFRKSSFEFLKRLAPTLNVNASQSRRESVYKIARQEVEGFTHLLKIYLSYVKDADLNNEEIFYTFILVYTDFGKVC